MTPEGVEKVDEHAARSLPLITRPRRVGARRHPLHIRLDIRFLFHQHPKKRELVFQLIDQLLKKRIRPIVGIGVGTPGLVNTREGIVVNAVNLDWRDLPLQARLGMHAAMDQDEGRKP